MHIHLFSIHAKDKLNLNGDWPPIQTKKCFKIIQYTLHRASVTDYKYCVKTKKQDFQANQDRVLQTFD